MVTERVRIMCAADEGFFPFVPTMLNSVARHTAADLEVGVLVQGVTSSAKRKLERHHPDVSIHFFDVDAGKLGGLYHKMALSPMSYARVLMPDLVDWDRFVYLDIDTIVLGDVLELYEAPIDDNPFAAVYPSGRLNAGMMVQNAAMWRERELGRQILEHARKHRPKEADQAAIETLCGDEGHRLAPEWNVLIDPIWGRVPSSTPGYYDSAKLLHFITGFKPWNMGRLLLPRDLVRLWDRYYVRTNIGRDPRSELRIVTWQGKTLATEAAKGVKARWLKRG